MAVFRLWRRLSRKRARADVRRATRLIYEGVAIYDATARRAGAEAHRRVSANHDAITDAVQHALVALNQEVDHTTEARRPAAPTTEEQTP